MPVKSRMSAKVKSAPVPPVIATSHAVARKQSIPSVVLTEPHNSQEANPIPTLPLRKGKGGREAARKGFIPSQQKVTKKDF